MLIIKCSFCRKANRARPVHPVTNVKVINKPVFIFWTGTVFVSCASLPSSYFDLLIGGMLKKIKILQFSFFHLCVNRFCKDIKGYIESCNTVLRYCLGGEFIMIRAPSCGKQCYSLVTVTTMKKNQAEEEDEKKKKSLHISK